MSIDAEQELFERCLEAPEHEREALLEAYPDPALRERVRRLLRAHEASLAGEAGGFADVPRIAMPHQIGPYRVLERLGEGAMGEVYLAEQHAPVRRRVALKILKFGMSSREVIARFELERQTLALMTHPNVARILEAGVTADGRPFFAMEYVPGIPISRYCDERRLSVEARLALFCQVCAGVQHAHLRGIIHRDLKPSNILVTELDGEPVPKIIDFGIAKATTLAGIDADAHTRLGNLLGTPEYMSPEQAQLSPLDIDARTDVYSLGVMLYELLTGSRPYAITRDVPTPAQLLREILERDPPKPSEQALRATASREERARLRGLAPRQLAARLHGDLDWIVLKALEKDRQRRYASPAELAADLHRHLEDDVVLAGPPSALYRAGKFVRRHRVGVAALGMLVIASVVFGSGMAWLAQQAARERDRATLEANTAGQVSQFLINLFKVSDPAQSRGATITARELLEAAAQRLEGELREQPIVRARLHNAIGEVYLNLSLWERAEQQFRTAQRLLEELVPPEDVTRLRALRGVARASIGQSRFEEAEKLLGEVLGLAREEPGGADATFADAQHELGALYFYQGRYPEAQQQFRAAYEARRRAYGPDAVQLAETLNNVAVLHAILREYDDAERVYRQVLEQLRRTHGDDHPQVLITQANLANTYAESGRSAEALRLEQELLPKMQRVLGETHRYTLLVSSNLANRLRGEGRYTEALRLHAHTSWQLTQVSGADSAGTLLARIEEAYDLALLGRRGEAARMVREVLDLTYARHGRESYETARLVARGAAVLRAVGEPAESSRLLEATLPHLRGTLGERHPLTGEVLLGLADGAYAQDRREDGARWLEQARASGARLTDLEGYPTLQRLWSSRQLPQSASRETAP